MRVVVVRRAIQGFVCSDEGAIELCDGYCRPLCCPKQAARYRKIYENVKGKYCGDVTYHCVECIDAGGLKAEESLLWWSPTFPSLHGTAQFAGSRASITLNQP